MRIQEDEPQAVSRARKGTAGEPHGAGVAAADHALPALSKAALTPAQVMHLQRTAGNAAVCTLLEQPVQREKGGSKGKGGAADSVTDLIDKEHAKYRGNFKKPLNAEAPSEYKITVAVSIDMPEYMKFAKTRMNSTIRNTIRGGIRSLPGAGAFVRKPKTGEQIKEKAAVKAAGKPAGTDVADPQVAEILENSDAVGHAWIKLSPVGASGISQTYSFGFTPDPPGLDHGPQEKVPGLVRNPDTEFEDGGGNSYADTKIDAKTYLRTLTHVGKLKAAPPNYMTIGYNCTQFTKAIAGVAGASFPAKAGMMIPISDRGFMKRALSPNALHAKMGKDLNTSTTSPERAGLESGDLDFDSKGRLESTAPAAFRGGPAASTRSAPRGLELVDPFDPTVADVKVNRDDEVIPTGLVLAGSWQVLYKGQELYADSLGELARHLDQQKPKVNQQYTLRGSLKVDTGGGRSAVLRPGTKIKVIQSRDGDSLMVETGRQAAQWVQGTFGDNLSFWEAVAGQTFG